EASLLPDLATALAAAFAGGFIARFLRLPTIIGYVAAGIAISPFTPGYSANVETVSDVADLGVIFLMFGIGLNFELRDLRAVQKVAIPGALALMVVLAVVGTGIGIVSGLDGAAAVAVGLAVCVCSSAVLSRSLQDRGLVDSIAGRLAIGVSIVEDLITVAILAVLPSLAAEGFGEALGDAGIAVIKAAAFVAIMVVVGSRVVPLVLRSVAGVGSRELFIVAVVAMALGIAVGGAELFEVSIAIGAFVAGVVISETEMGHQATADVVPLREAFAVLFFVSVGMLVDPGEVVGEIPLLLGIGAMVLFIGPVSVVGLFALMPYPGRVALIVGASLAHFGEFSFLIARDALNLELIDGRTHNAILAASALTIGLNPIVYNLMLRSEPFLARFGPIWKAIDRQGPLPAQFERMQGHVVILGYGRVGELTGHALSSLQRDFVIIEGDLPRARTLSRSGLNVIWGDAASEHVLSRANVDRATLVVSALPDENSTLLAINNLRRIAPAIPAVVRARARDELRELARLGVEEVVVPEYEGGLELMSQALIALGYPAEDAELYRLAIRDIHYDIESLIHHETAGPA
ncbi:MAG: cation:proton antiporter, partial [Dehalococcoidia bacterium]|nr:cation:proton antiporter [Dehalococcoidia bacterium]